MDDLGSTHGYSERADDKVRRKMRADGSGTQKTKLGSDNSRLSPDHGVLAGGSPEYKAFFFPAFNNR